MITIKVLDRERACRIMRVLFGAYPSHYTTIEGGLWHEVRFSDDTEKIAKAHSIRFSDGKEWDEINGFRDITTFQETEIQLL